MKIKHVVIHALRKEQNKDIESSKIASDVLSPTDKTVEKLVSSVDDVYATKRNSAHYGVFLSGEGKGTFPDEFHSMESAEKFDDKDFIRLTKCAMDEMYRSAKSQRFSSGGLMLFANYETDGGKFFLVAMIKQKPGMRVTDDLAPKELLHLELDRLHQAARINYGKYRNYLKSDKVAKQSINYLSFVSPATNKEASGYFIAALGCSSGTTSAKAVETLLTESEKYFEENSVLKSRRHDLREKLVEYLSGKAESGESARLSEIGEVVRKVIPVGEVDDSEMLIDGLIGKLNGEECSVPTEFPVKRASIRKHTHIKAKSVGWSVEFSRQKLGDNQNASIYYNKQTNSLTFNDIPDQLKQDILEEIEGGNDED